MIRLSVLVLFLATFCLRASGQTNFVLLASDGAWSWFNDPRALYHNGVLYFGYVRNNDGRCVLSAYHPQSGEKTVLWTSTRAQMDERFNPALVVREDGRLLALHTRPNGPGLFWSRLSTSANPVSPADWGEEQPVPVGGAPLTYASAYQLETKDIYSFCRGTNHNPVVLMSGDGGTNWSAPRLLIAAGNNNTRPYVKYCSAGGQRIDFVYNNGHPRDLPCSLYHAYYENGAIYQSDGKLLRKFADLPLRHDAGERGTVVYQYSNANTSEFDKHIPTGRAWCWDVARQSNGHPVCVFSVQRDQMAGTNWFDDRMYYYYARWTGTNWQKRFIAHAGHPLYMQENDFAGGICLDPEDPNVVYLSSSAAAPFKLISRNTALQASKRHEIYRGVTADGGLTFEWTAVTTNSTVDNLRPYVPRHHGGSPAVIWFRGEYSTFARYNCPVVGMFPNPASRAAGTEYESRLWRMEDGLPHNSVQAVTQTRDGFLWVGTRQGLVQFDGLQFRPVPELTNTPITALCEEPDGTLWIGTDGVGIRRYRAGKCSPMPGGGAPNNLVKALVTGRNGSVWAGTTNGLSRFQDGKLLNLFDRDTVWGICEGQGGEVLIATEHGLKLYRGGEVREVTGTRSAAAHAVQRGQGGEIWVGTGEGLDCVTQEGAKPFGRRDGSAAEAVKTIYLDRNGTVWIGTAGGLKYLTEGGAVREIRHEGEAFDAVYSICEDQEGNLWAGARDGLHRVNAKYFRTYTKQHGLANNDVTSVLQDRVGKLWIGTWGGGLHVMEDGKISRVPSANRFFNELVLGLAADRSGSIWLGTDFEGGMFRYERGQFIRYWKEQGISLLADPAVRAIHIDSRKGRVWVGSRDALNVAYRAKPFERFTTANGMAGNSVRVILEDHAGGIWVGTDGGLTRFQDEELSRLTTRDGLSHNAVTGLFEDAAHTLWVATAGGGLNRFRQRKFTAYTTSQGLFSDEIFEVIEDNYQRLWMTCRAGIFWVAKEDIAALDAGELRTLRCVTYGKDDGLLAVACNNIARPSVCKSDDGRLWFATVKGLSVVDPREIPNTHNPPPPVVIREVLFDGRPFAPASDVKLPPGHGELEFRFTTLSFRGPERQRFKYQLEGVDGSWVEAGGRRFAHYNNIYPGDYRFHVQACNSDGVWNETGATLAITLAPHFWQTWWFRLAGVAAAVMVVAVLYKARVAQIRELERLRLRIAADLHDEIGSSIGSIALLARKIQKTGPLAEEQKGDLASVQRIATQALDSIQDIVWFLNPKYDTVQDLLAHMKDAASGLAGTVRLRFTAPQENLGRKLSPAFCRNVSLMYKEILGNIAKHARASEVEVAVVDQEGVWLLMVSDNGVGFDPNANHAGHGLSNLRHRAGRVAGSLEIRSQPGAGTTVIFSTTKW